MSVIWGVKIPPTNLKPDYVEEARVFATGLADGLVGGVRNESVLRTRPNGDPKETRKVSAHE